jgi:hypothetical protein
MVRFILLPVFLVIAASTSTGGSPAQQSGLSGSMAARCPQLSEAAGLPYRPGGGRLRGDVDGDGRLDRVSIRYAPAAPASCGILLVVETRSRAVALRVAWEYKPGLGKVRARDIWTPEPYLAAIVQLVPGRSQIVIARNHGASTASVSFVGVLNGKLALIPFQPRVYADELSLFGSAGTGVTNARCRRGGPLVVFGISPTSYSGKRWYFSSEEYRLKSGLLQRTSMSTITVSRERVHALARQHGLDALPFTGCTIARGRRL